MRAVLMSLAALLAASACAIADQHTDEDEPLPEGVENCVTLRSVDRIEILDEHVESVECRWCGTGDGVEELPPEA